MEQFTQDEYSNPAAGWGLGAGPVDDLGDLTELLGPGYFGQVGQHASPSLAQVQAEAEAQRLEEAQIEKAYYDAEKHLDSNIPKTGEQLNNLLQNLYKSPGLAQADNAYVLEKVIEFLTLIFQLESKVIELGLGREYSYVHKYIIPGPNGQYGLDIREINHLHNSISALSIVSKLYRDSPDAILQAAYLTARESFNIGGGLAVFQETIKDRISDIGIIMDKAVKNISKLAYDMTVAKIKSVKGKLFGFNPREAADATRFLVAHSLKIQSYIYSMILGVEVVINNIGQLLMGTTTLSVDVLGFLARITQTGLGLYGYLMDVLVTNPSPTAYSVLLAIFTIKRYEIGYGVVKQFLDKVDEIGHNLKEKLRNEGVIDRMYSMANRGRSFMLDFDEFCTQSLTIFAEPLAKTVEGYKNLRFSGAERKLDQLIGLRGDNRDKVMELLVTPDAAKNAAPSQADLEKLELIEDPSWEPTLTVPIEIYEREIGGRFIFENHILSEPAPQEHAVAVTLPIGYNPLGVSVVGEGKKRSKQKRLSKGKTSRKGKGKGKAN